MSHSRTTINAKSIKVTIHLPQSWPPIVLEAWREANEKWRNFQASGTEWERRSANDARARFHDRMASAATCPHERRDQAERARELWGI